jgi:4'-phosphopantetheinyl transferase
MLKLYTYELVDDETFISFHRKYASKIPQTIYEGMTRYKFPQDQQRYFIGQLMVRCFYSELLKIPMQSVEFEYNEQEKPFLKNNQEQFFNISHSGAYVVVCYSDRPVGVDVECIKKDRRKVAERFFTPQEINDIHQQESEEQQISYFYRLWTLKESYMKAVGDGMTMSLSSFSIIKASTDGFVVQSDEYPTDWHLFSTPWNHDSFLSICSKYNAAPEKNFLSLDLMANKIRGYK